MERILLHTCCAPCSIHCVENLRGEGIEPVSFWYNPNIHPFQEYKARRDTLKGYAASIGMELILADDYGLFPFTEAVAGDLGRRCGRCFRVPCRRVKGNSRMGERKCGALRAGKSPYPLFGGRLHEICAARAAPGQKVRWHYYGPAKLWAGQRRAGLARRG